MLLAGKVMYFTYVLKCSSDKLPTEFYTGVTNELPNRLDDHLHHGVKTTKKFDKIELVYFEGCLNKKDAYHREKQLKTGFGRGYIKRRISNYLKDAGLVHR